VENGKKRVWAKMSSLGKRVSKRDDQADQNSAGSFYLSYFAINFRLLSLKIFKELLSQQLHKFIHKKFVSSLLKNSNTNNHKLVYTYNKQTNIEQ
jgi:hypothetical protein